MTAQFPFKAWKGFAKQTPQRKHSIFVCLRYFLFFWQFVCLWYFLFFLTMWKQNIDVSLQMFDLSSMQCCRLSRIDCLRLDLNFVVASWSKLSIYSVAVLVRERAWSKFGISCSSKSFVIISTLYNRRFVSQTVLTLLMRSSTAMAVSNPSPSL